eukprot:403352441
MGEEFSQFFDGHSQICLNEDSFSQTQNLQNQYISNQSTKNKQGIAENYSQIQIIDNQSYNNSPAKSQHSLKAEMKQHQSDKLINQYQLPSENFMSNTTLKNQIPQSETQKEQFQQKNPVIQNTLELKSIETSNSNQVLKSKTQWASNPRLNNWSTPAANTTKTTVQVGKQANIAQTQQIPNQKDQQQKLQVLFAESKSLNIREQNSNSDNVFIQSSVNGSSQKRQSLISPSSNRTNTKNNVGQSNNQLDPFNLSEIHPNENNDGDNQSEMMISRNLYEEEDQSYMSKHSSTNQFENQGSMKDLVEQEEQEHSLSPIKINSYFQNEKAKWKGDLDQLNVIHQQPRLSGNEIEQVTIKLHNKQFQGFQDVSSIQDLNDLEVTINKNPSINNKQLLQQQHEQQMPINLSRIDSEPIINQSTLMQLNSQQAKPQNEIINSEEIKINFESIQLDNNSNNQHLKPPLIQNFHEVNKSMQSQSNQSNSVSQQQVLSQGVTPINGANSTQNKTPGSNSNTTWQKVTFAKRRSSNNINAQQQQQMQNSQKNNPIGSLSSKILNKQQSMPQNPNQIIDYETNQYNFESQQKHQNNYDLISQNSNNGMIPDLKKKKPIKKKKSGDILPVFDCLFCCQEHFVLKKINEQTLSVKYAKHPIRFEKEKDLMIINRVIKDQKYREKSCQICVQNINQEYETKVARILLELDVQERQRKINNEETAGSNINDFKTSMKALQSLQFQSQKPKSIKLLYTLKAIEQKQQVQNQQEPELVIYSKPEEIQQNQNIFGGLSMVDSMLDQSNFLNVNLRTRRQRVLQNISFESEFFNIYDPCYTSQEGDSSVNLEDTESQHFSKDLEEEDEESLEDESQQSIDDDLDNVGFFQSEEADSVELESDEESEYDDEQDDEDQIHLEEEEDDQITFPIQQQTVDLQDQLSDQEVLNDLNLVRGLSDRLEEDLDEDLVHNGEDDEDIKEIVEVCNQKEEQMKHSPPQNDLQNSRKNFEVNNFSGEHNILGISSIDQKNDEDVFEGSEEDDVNVTPIIYTQNNTQQAITGMSNLLINVDQKRNSNLNIQENLVIADEDEDDDSDEGSQRLTFGQQTPKNEEQLFQDQQKITFSNYGGENSLSPVRANGSLIIKKNIIGKCMGRKNSKYQTMKVQEEYYDQQSISNGSHQKNPMYLDISPNKIDFYPIQDLDKNEEQITSIPQIQNQKSFDDYSSNFISLNNIPRKGTFKLDSQDDLSELSQLPLQMKNSQHSIENAHTQNLNGHTVTLSDYPQIYSQCVTSNQNEDSNIQQFINLDHQVAQSRSFTNTSHPKFNHQKLLPAQSQFKNQTNSNVLITPQSQKVKNNQMQEVQPKQANRPQFLTKQENINELLKKVNLQKKNQNSQPTKQQQQINQRHLQSFDSTKFNRVDSRISHQKHLASSIEYGDDLQILQMMQMPQTNKIVHKQKTQALCTPIDTNDQFLQAIQFNGNNTKTNKTTVNQNGRRQNNSNTGNMFLGTCKNITSSQSNLLQIAEVLPIPNQLFTNRKLNDFYSTKNITAEKKQSVKKQASKASDNHVSRHLNGSTSKNTSMKVIPHTQSPSVLKNDKKLFNANNGVYLQQNMNISKKDFDQYMKTHLLSSRYATNLPFNNILQNPHEFNSNYDVMGATKTSQTQKKKRRSNKIQGQAKVSNINGLLNQAARESSSSVTHQASVQDGNIQKKTSQKAVKKSGKKIKASKNLQQDYYKQQSLQEYQSYMNICNSINFSNDYSIPSQFGGGLPQSMQEMGQKSNSINSGNGVPNHHQSKSSQNNLMYLSMQDGKNIYGGMSICNNTNIQDNSNNYPYGSTTQAEMSTTCISNGGCNSNQITMNQQMNNTKNQISLSQKGKHFINQTISNQGNQSHINTTLNNQAQNKHSQNKASLIEQNLELNQAHQLRKNINNIDNSSNQILLSAQMQALMNDQSLNLSTTNKYFNNKQVNALQKQNSIQNQTRQKATQPGVQQFPLSHIQLQKPDQINQRMNNSNEDISLFNLLQSLGRAGNPGNTINGAQQKQPKLKSESIKKNQPVQQNLTKLQQQQQQQTSSLRTSISIQRNQNPQSLTIHQSSVEKQPSQHRSINHEGELILHRTGLLNPSNVAQVIGHHNPGQFSFSQNNLKLNQTTHLNKNTVQHKKRKSKGGPGASASLIGQPQSNHMNSGGIINTTSSSSTLKNTSLQPARRNNGQRTRSTSKSAHSNQILQNNIIKTDQPTHQLLLQNQVMGPSQLIEKNRQVLLNQNASNIVNLTNQISKQNSIKSSFITSKAGKKSLMISSDHLPGTNQNHLALQQQQQQHHTINHFPANIDATSLTRMQQNQSRTSNNPNQDVKQIKQGAHSNQSVNQSQHQHLHSLAFQSELNKMYDTGKIMQSQVTSPLRPLINNIGVTFGNPINNGLSQNNLVTGQSGHMSNLSMGGVGHGIKNDIFQSTIRANNINNTAQVINKKQQ